MSEIEFMAIMCEAPVIRRLVVDGHEQTARIVALALITGAELHLNAKESGQILAARRERCYEIEVAERGPKHGSSAITFRIVKNERKYE